MVIVKIIRGRFFDTIVSKSVPKLSHLSQKCPKNVPLVRFFVPKLSQKCPQKCPKFVPKMSQKMSQICPNTLQALSEHFNGKMCVPKMSHFCPKSVPNPAFVVKMPSVFAGFSQSSKPIPAIARCSISTSFFDAASNDLELGGFALQCLSQGLQPGCASVILLRAAAVYDLLPILSSE